MKKHTAAIIAAYPLLQQALTAKSMSIKTLLLAVALFTGTLFVVWSTQAAQPTANDKAAMKVERKFRQYKRVHQELLKQILEKDVDTAIAEMNEILSIVPKDGETHLMLALAYCQKDELPQALAHTRQAIEKGVPVSRFMAGEYSGFKKLWSVPEFQALTKRETLLPAHGPTLGHLSHDAITVWLRTHGSRTLQVSAHSKEQQHTIESEPFTTSSDHDFIAKIRLKNLKPDAEYSYSITIDGRTTQSTEWRFSTFNRPDAPIRFTVAFGGGAGYVPQHEKMWSTIHRKSPDLLLLLGDNVYSDDPTTHQMQRYCYYRRQSRPEYRSLTSQTPTYTIWDDHDFGTNDCQGGPQILIPEWKPDVLEVFKENWPNPGFGSDAAPGCFYDFKIGDVHFIMLDGRYYRDLQKSDSDSSMLGPVQLQWLFDTVSQSDSTIKVLVSPVPWVFGAKGDSRDTWNGFKHERERIFEFLNEHSVDGIVLMSADRHRSDLWRIPRADTYDLYELNSSRLTNQHVHKTMPEAVFSYNKKQSYGHVTFDTKTDDAGVTYKIINIDGDVIFSHHISLSDLIND